jgi:hypothetical protein
VEKRSSADPGSRGFSRTDSGTNTPESHKARCKSPNASGGQPVEASYTANDECSQTSLTVKRYDSGVQGKGQTERFGSTTRESSVDSTPLGGSE